MKPSISFDETAAALESAGRVEDLVHLCEAHARFSSPPESAVLLARAADIVRTRLKDLSRAEEILRRGLYAGHDARPILEGLKAVYEQKQDAGPLTDILERLAGLEGGENAAALLVQAADLYEQKLQRKDRAVLCLQRALRLDPNQPGLGRRIRGLLGVEAHALAVFESLEREEKVNPTPELAAEFAALAEALVDDPTEHDIALRAAESAKVLGHEGASNLLKTLSRFDVTWRDRVRILRGQSLEERDRRRAAKLSLTVAKLFAWFEPAAQGKMKEALDRTLLLWPAMPDALTFLEKFAERTGDFPATVAWFEKLALDAKEKPQQAEIWVRAGLLRLTRQLDFDGALEAFLKALAADPSRSDATSLAAELLLERGRKLEAVEVFEGHLATVKERTSQLSLSLRIADLCATQLKDSAKARVHYASVLRLEPANATAALELVRQKIQSESLEGLDSLLEVALLANRPLIERIAMCEAASQLLDEADAPQESFNALLLGWKLAPTRPDLLDSVLSQAQKAGVQAAFAESLRGAASAATDTESAVILLCALAQLLQGDLQSPAEAREAWQEVVGLAPRNMKALGALSVLEGVLGRHEVSVLRYQTGRARARGSDGEVSAVDAGAALPDAALVSTGAALPDAGASHRDQTSVLRDEAKPARSSGSAEDAVIVSAGAALPSANASPENPFFALEQQLLGGGSLAEAAARTLIPTYERNQDHRKLVVALEVLAERSADPRAQALALEQQADVQLRHLGQPELAFASLARALRLLPEEASVRASARKAAEAADMMDSYADALHAAAQRSAGPASVPLLLELAEVRDQLGEPDASIEALRACVSVVPDSPDALKALARLHRTRKEWPALAEVLNRLSRLIAAPEQAPLLGELALLQEQQTHDLQGAAAAWRRLLELDPQHREAALSLERLYRALELPEEVAFALALRATQEGDTPQGRLLGLAEATFRRDVLGDSEEALRRAGAILELDPRHEETRAWLEGWAATDSPQSVDVFRVLDAAFKRTDEPALRVRIRESRHLHATPTERATLAREICSLYEKELRKPELAFIAALKAFAEGIDRPQGQEDLERLARLTGNYEELCVIYESAADGLPATDPDVGVYLRRAAQLREQLVQNAEALTLWQALLAVLPADEEALDRLTALAEGSKDARALAALYAQRSRLTKSPEERRRLLLKAGAAYEAAGEDDVAIEAYRAALALEERPDALEPLERLFAKCSRLEDQALMLGRLLEKSEGEERRGYMRRRAQVLEEAGDAGQALQTYRDLLTDAPEDAFGFAGIERLFKLEAVRLPASLLLEPRFRNLKDNAKLVEVLETRLLLSPPTDEARGELVREIANLRESLGDSARAFSLRLQELQRSPEDAANCAELERLAADTGSFAALAQGFEDTLAKTGDAALASELWRKLSVLYSDRLNRYAPAVHALEELARLEPANAQALDSLSRLHRGAKDFRALAGVLKRQVVLEPSVDKQVGLLFDLAALAEKSLADLPLAAQCYGEVLRRKEEHSEALVSLDRVLTDSERWPELQTLLVKEIALADAAKREEAATDLMVRLGRLKLNQLEDPRGALDMFKAILNRKALHAGAVGALEDMARSNSPLRGEAASTLEPVFEAGGDPVKHVAMLEARASAETVPSARVALLRKVAELYAGPLNNPEMAFVAATRALRELPDSAESLELSVALARRAETGEELATLLEEIAAKASDDTARANLFRALAREQETLGEKSAALASWKQVLTLAPSDSQALTTVSRLYAESGQPEELLEVIRRQLSIAEEPEERAALLDQMGTLQEESLNDTAGALTTYRRLLELAPKSARALMRIEGLAEKQERWPELADVLAQRLSLQGDAPDAELKYRLATVRESRLKDRLGALTLYIEILSGQPRHPGALARLEAIVAAEPDHRSAAEALLNAYRSAREVHKLAQALEARVKVSSDSAERKGLLLELAGIRDAQAEPELTFLALFRAFSEDPNDAAVREKFEKAADEAKVHDELASAYEAVLPRIAEGPEAARIGFKLGQLYELKLAEPARAAVAYEKVRSLDPALAPRALLALERLYAGLERWPELAATLASLAENAVDPAEKVGLLFRLGQVAQEKLDDVSRAAAAYEEAIALDRTQLAAARLLEQIYEAAGHPQKLYAVLKAQVDVAQGPERERVLTKMAQVSAVGLSDSSQSISLYQEVLAKNPRNEAAFTALEQALEGAERYDDIRLMIVKRLEGTLDPRELVRLNSRLGSVLLRLLKKPEEAIPAFRAALDRDARHRTSLESLQEIYELLEKKEELVAVLRRLIPVQEGAEGVKPLRIRLAEVLAEMGRREEALDAARRALEVEPHTIPELERVQLIFIGLKAFSDAVRAMELRAEVYNRLEERDHFVATLFEIAEVWRGPANKPEAAAQILERVLEKDPANRKAFEEVLKLHSQHKDWRAYATALDRYLPNYVTDEEKIEALRKLGKIREQKLGQKDGAFLSLCRALELNPADDALREDVERLAEETGSYDELAAVYESVADNLPKGPLAERLYRVLAKIQDERLDDPEAAEAALRKILEFDPTNPVALEALTGMFERRGRMRELVASLEQKLDAAGTLEQRKAILRQIARVQDEKLENHDEAAHALTRALDVEPDPETFRELAALYRKHHRWTALAHTLIRARDLASTPEERARIQREVGVVHEQDLGDAEAAVAAYAAALEYDPTNKDTLEALERVYTKLDRPSDLLAIFERQLNLTEDYRARVTILFRSAAIWEDKFGNPANADACIEGVLALDATNLQAIKTLARLRREQERWEELVGTLGRHIQLISEPKEQAALYVEMGEVYRGQIQLFDRAADAYQAALQVDPDCAPAMHALGTLYEKSGNWPFALEMLQREAAVTSHASQAVELHYRMGTLNEDMLQDRESAKACFLSALGIDERHVPSLRALKAIYLGEEDWASYERALLKEAESTEDVEQKSRALLEAALYYQDRREEPETALQYFEDAVRLSPALVEAARPLSDLYSSRENWEGAEQMVEVVIRDVRARVALESGAELARDLCRHLYRLGYVAEKLGKRDKALESYEEAYQLDATYLPALEGLGNLLVQTGRHDEALKVYQTILVHHREDLTDLEVVEVYWQIGEVYQGLKQADRAQNHFEKALSIDPGHEPSLRALIQVADAQGKHEKSAEYRQSLVEVLEGEEKLKTYLDLAVLAREKLNDAYIAIDAYVGALKLAPGSLEVMDSLYILYRETRQPQKASEILRAMLEQPELQEDADRAKRVYFALGGLIRDELKEVTGAVDAFNRALDLDPAFVEAFSAIEALLGQERQWRLLEENYSRMVQRLPKTEETHAARMALWRGLGDLYLQVLKQPDAALMAYQVAAAGLPDDALVQEAYGDLAAQSPGNEEHALAAYRRAVGSSAHPGKVVSAFAALAAKQKDYDAAYLAAQVVSSLIGQPGAGEREILTKLAPYAKKREATQKTLTDRQWHDLVFHPKTRGPLGELLALLFTQAGHLYSVSFAQVQVNPKKHRIEASSAPEYQIHHYRTVAKLLGMQSVEVYSPYLASTREKGTRRNAEPAPEPMVGVEICHTHPVCLKFGGRFFGEPGQKEVYAMLGKTMAFLRPELALTQRLAPDRLRAVIQAAISLTGLSFRYTVNPQLLEAERQALERALSEPARASLVRVSQAYVKAASSGDVEEFLMGAELTAVRTALFAAGEVEPVRKLLAGEGGAAHRLSAKAKLAELMSFAISEDLSALRHAMGTNVEVPTRK